MGFIAKTPTYFVAGNRSKLDIEPNWRTRDYISQSAVRREIVRHNRPRPYRPSHRGKTTHGSAKRALASINNAEGAPASELESATHCGSAICERVSAKGETSHTPGSPHSSSSSS